MRSLHRRGSAALAAQTLVLALLFLLVSLNAVFPITTHSSLVAADDSEESTAGAATTTGGGASIDYDSLAEVLASLQISPGGVARPTAVLFTSAATAATSSVSALAKKAVASLAAAVTPELFAVRHYAARSPRELRVVEVLTRGQRLPCLALFNAELNRGYVSPGSAASAAWGYAPSVYQGSWRNETRMRRWLLAAAPRATVPDAVSGRALPSLLFAQSPRDLRALVTSQLLPAVADGSVPAPRTLLLARVHLSTRGSEEILAALAAARAGPVGGPSVVIVATESARLARLFGLTKYNTAAYVPFEAVRRWAEERPEANKEKDAKETAPPPVVVSLRSVAVAAPQPLDADTTFAAVAAAVRSAASASAASVDDPSALETAQRQRLAEWRRSIDAYLGASPLRRLDSRAELLHELQATQGALRLLFFFRASDEFFFRGHVRLAADLAARLRNATVPYKSLSGGRTLRWQPVGRVVPYWIDAERHPRLASQLKIHRVPAVAAVWDFPNPDNKISSNGGNSDDEDGGSGGEDPQLAGLTEAEKQHVRMLRRDPMAFLPMDAPVGMHVMTHYDLHVDDEVGGGLRAPRQAELKHDFPADADTLIRFLVRPTVIQRFSMNSVQFAPSQLEMEDAVASKAAGGAAETLAAAAYAPPYTMPVSAPARLVSTHPNEVYLNLDQRHYDRVPFVPPSLVRSALSDGGSPLPPYDPAADDNQDEEEDDDEDGEGGGKSGGHDDGDGAGEPDSPAKRRRAELAAKWAEELRQRAERKKVRTSEKNAKMAAEREAELESLKEKVIEAARTQRKRPPVIRVARPPAPPGKKKVVKPYLAVARAFMQEATYMAEAVVLSDGVSLGISDFLQ